MAYTAGAQIHTVMTFPKNRKSGFWKNEKKEGRKRKANCLCIKAKILNVLEGDMDQERRGRGPRISCYASVHHSLVWINLQTGQEQLVMDHQVIRKDHLVPTCPPSRTCCRPPETEGWRKSLQTPQSGKQFNSNRLLLTWMFKLHYCQS